MRCNKHVSSSISLIFFRVGRNPYEVCLHSSLKLPGGDTLLDVHPTQLQVLRKVCILPSWIYLEGYEGRAKRCISARSDRSEDGGAPRRGPAFISFKIDPLGGNFCWLKK